MNHHALSNVLLTVGSQMLFESQAESEKCLRHLTPFLISLHQLYTVLCREQVILANLTLYGVLFSIYIFSKLHFQETLSIL